MRIGGVENHINEHTHHVTSMAHDHVPREKEPLGGLPQRESNGGFGASSETQRSRFSLSEWIADPLKSLRKFALRIWNGGDSGSGVSAGTGERQLTGEEQPLAGALEEVDADAAGGGMSGAADDRGNPQASVQANVQTPSAVLHNPQIAAAATGVPQQNIYNNPYFAAIEDTGRQSQHIWQKMKVRFHSVAGFLTRRFSFSGRNSFQAKQEKPKEDLRRRSRYRSENLDVECVLTDDSYLLDSYDRSGNYRQLSTRDSATALAAQGERKEQDVRPEGD